MSHAPTNPSPPERKPGVAAKLALSLGTLVVLAVVGEIAARVAGYGATPQFLEVRSHEHLQMVPLPNQEKFVGVDDPVTGEQPVPMRVNVHGHRGPDYPLEKAPDELRIIGLGDSLTFGRGVGTDETYLALLAADFAADPITQPAGRQPNVVNASFNGYATYHYEQWALTQLERFQPDVLLVGVYAGNDQEPVGDYGHGALFDLTRKSALRRMLIAGYNEFLWKRVRAWKQGTSVEEVEQDLDRYRGTAGPQRELAQALWRDSMEHLRGIRAAAEAHDVPVACILIPTSWMTGAEQEPPFYAWLREQVEETGLPVIDLYPALAAVDRAPDDAKDEPSSPWLSFDAGHLNVEGHRVAMRTVRGGLAGLGIVE